MEMVCVFVSIILAERCWDGKTYATSGELLGAAVLVTTKGVADILVSAEDVEQT